MNRPPFSADNNLYLLSMLDTSDRLNILLLEVRHLQQSIIDILHDPTLYLLLRHEENYIFDGWETDKKIQKKLQGKSVGEIIKTAIIRYPSPQEAVKFWNGDKNKHIEGITKIEAKILDRLGEIWTGDTWVRGERQHYYALMGLQVLKQQIFRDKVLLFKHAKNTGLINLEEGQKRSGQIDKSEFLIFRRGVHHRLERYIESLRTQQQNFSKSLDFGLQRDPRPSMDRRREIGIFHDFLSNRTIDLKADTTHLMSYLMCDSDSRLESKVEKKQKRIDKERGLRRDSPMLLHGWSQFMKVRNRPLWDDVGRDLNESSENSEENWRRDVCYIDTSFWSPDRPDLQPLVAKEIVYSVMRTISYGFSDDYFSNEANELSKLWVTLAHVINDYSKGREGLKPIYERSEYLIRHLVTDCIAASVKGISYLYALFLAENAFGLESLLKVDRTVRLEAVAELSLGIGSYSEHFEWYFRLRFTSFWLREVSGFKHLSLSEIDKTVLDGVDDICESMILFLDEHNAATRDAVGVEWKILFQEIKKVTLTLPICNITKKWREKRSRDTWNEVNNCSGRKEYHRSTMPLDVRLQNFLFRETVRQKRQKYKALWNKPSEDLLQEFCDAYGLKLGETRIPYVGDKYTVKQPNHIYRQLHDIPFQCAIMRSMDLLGRRDKEMHTLPTWKAFVTQSHENMGFGREIYSFALEFYTWRRESPKSRLLLSINLLSFLLPTLQTTKNKDFKELVEVFRFWLYADYKTRRGLADASEKLIEKVSRRKYDYRKVLATYACGEKGDLDNCIRNLSAVQIDDALACGGNSVKAQRCLEQIAGYKVKELSRLCDLYILPFIKNKKDLFKYLGKDLNFHIDALLTMSSLRHFLSIRDDTKNKPASMGRFYNLLFKAFDGGKEDKQYYDVTKTDDKGSDNKKGRLRGSVKKVTRLLSQNDDMSLNHLGLEENLPEAINPIIVSRLSLTSFYTVANPKRLVNMSEQQESQETENALSLFQVLEKERWYREDTGSQYAVVLGRYDVVSLTKTRLPCLCRVSCFHNVKEENENKFNTENEQFALHFARREIAFPLQIYGQYEFNPTGADETNVASIETHTIYAIASISLQRRSMRLNLLYRLLNALNYDDLYAESSIEEYIRDLVSSSSIQRNLAITGLLTDGWGDLLLVFMVRKGVHVGNLYEKILDLQQSLYEDFMVDRTELIYTPQCLDNMLKSREYRLSFLFRFQADRKLECSLGDFAKALRRKAKNLPEFIRVYEGNDLEVLFTPGQYDIRLCLNVDVNKKLDKIYQALLGWLAEKEFDTKNPLYNQWYQDGLSFIDSIETSIERIKN